VRTCTLLRFSFIMMFFSVSLFAQNEKMPSVILTDLNGNKINTTDYIKAGKVYVIDFWATWSQPSKKALENMREFNSDWAKDYNAEIVAVSIDNVQNRSKVQSQSANFPYAILLDPNQDLVHALDFKNIPYIIIVDKNGTIAFSHSGYVDGDELAIEEQLKQLSK
jgi:cytochrome c biogenesis protein CcmG/thiol:disulfide interchange protein DsbE